MTWNYYILRYLDGRTLTVRAISMADAKWRAVHRYHAKAAEVEAATVTRDVTDL